MRLVSGVTYWLGAFSGGGGEVKVLVTEHVQKCLFNLSSLCWLTLTRVNNLLSEALNPLSEASLTVQFNRLSHQGGSGYLL